MRPRQRPGSVESRAGAEAAARCPRIQTVGRLAASPAGLLNAVLALATLTLTTAAGPPLLAAEPALSWPDPTIRLDPGSLGGEVRVFFSAAGLQAGQLAEAAAVTDLGGTSAPETSVVFEPPVEVTRGTTTRAWIAKAVVNGLPPRSSQQRFARLSLGNLEQTVAYTLTNLPRADFSWSVKGPSSPWILWRGLVGRSRMATTLVLTATEGAATGVRLAQVSLPRATGTELGLDDLELCDAASGPCSDPVAVASGSTQTLHLRLKSRRLRDWPHGEFKGTVSLAVNERPELQTVNLAVESSSWAAWVLGLLLLGAGTALGWHVNVWTRSRTARLEAFQAVAAVRRIAAEIGNVLEAAPPQVPRAKAPQLTRAHADLVHALATPELDARRLLPPDTPRISQQPFDSTRLTTYLEEKAHRLAALLIVVRAGMEVLWGEWTSAPNRRAQIEAALSRLDQEGAGLADEAAAKKLVEEALAAARRPVGPTVAADAAMGLAPRVDLGAREIAWELAALHQRAWLVWGFLTVLVGAAVLILPKSAFGTALDLAFCLFWGAGLPVAVDRLQALGPGGVGSSIGVQLPKTSP